MKWNKLEDKSPRRGSVVWVLEELRNRRGSDGYVTAMYKVEPHDCRQDPPKDAMYPITTERWHSDGSAADIEGYELYPICWAEIDIPRQPALLMTGKYDFEIMDDIKAAALRAWLNDPNNEG